MTDQREREREKGGKKKKKKKRFIYLFKNANHPCMPQGKINCQLQPDRLEQREKNDPANGFVFMGERISI